MANIECIFKLNYIQLYNYTITFTITYVLAKIELYTYLTHVYTCIPMYHENTPKKMLFLHKI